MGFIVLAANCGVWPGKNCRSVYHGAELARGSRESVRAVARVGSRLAEKSVFYHIFDSTNRSAEGPAATRQNQPGAWRFLPERAQ